MSKKEQIINEIRKIYDPELPVNIYELGLIYDIKVEGELQFDSAFDPLVSSIKVNNSNISGKCNVFIFPNLDAANIAYKIAERMAGAVAIGPILDGLKKPANDVSRGCGFQDIVNVIAITNIQAHLGMS